MLGFLSDDSFASEAPSSLTAEESPPPFPTGVPPTTATEATETAEACGPSKETPESIHSLAPGGPDSALKGQRSERGRRREDALLDLRSLRMASLSAAAARKESRPALHERAARQGAIAEAAKERRAKESSLVAEWKRIEVGYNAIGAGAGFPLSSDAWLADHSRLVSGLAQPSTPPQGRPPHASNGRYNRGLSYEQTEASAGRAPPMTPRAFWGVTCRLDGWRHDGRGGYLKRLMGALLAL